MLKQYIIAAIQIKSNQIKSKFIYHNLKYSKQPNLQEQIKQSYT